MDAFDAAFFGISPREALAMDPQQRLFLECAWHTFESAGYTTARLSGSNTAVFAAVSSFDYYELLLRTQAARTTHIGTGMSHAVLANRVSQHFNLKGASEAIDTACSSGLVALWRAVETLRRGESELALVGGVNVLASQTPFQVFADAGMLSLEGACRPFDARAAGYVRGEGVACVLVKRAADAVRDGDRIWAVIKGGAIRHSGRTNSLTAPNPDAQADVIVAAVADAGIDPLSIGYVEAHGTGTSLGDPIEANGLKRAFRRLHAERGRTEVAPHFTVGSVKAQIGHLEAAAGMAGLLKAVLALGHRAIPGSPHLTEVNPHIDLADACFRFSPESATWEEPARQGQPRRAGVSSFGFGGVNAHVVLEEGPVATPRISSASGPQLFVLSAKTADALRKHSSALAAALAAQSFVSGGEEQTYLADLAFTLRKRTPLAHRLAVIAASAAELAAHLRQWTQGGPDVVSGIAQAGTHEAMGLFASEAEVEERLRALVAAGELRKLAALWVKGFGIEWERIVPRAGAALVTTPGYPFARESFWVTFGNADVPAAAPASAPVAATRTPRRSGRHCRTVAGRLYAEGWLERPLNEAGTLEPPTQDEDRQGAVIALASGPIGRRVAELVGRGRRVLIASLPDGATAEALVADAGRISGLLDVTALDGDVRSHKPPGTQQARVRPPVDRRIAQEGRAPGRSPGDARPAALGDRSAPTSLSGAQEAGFYKSLWAEYRRCRSKTVDFAPAGFTAENAAAAIGREIDRHDGPSELAYVGGKRMARAMERVPLALPQPERERNGVALITGGTGEIGLALARDLVARGFRALLLTGRRELSPEQQRLIDDLASQGASIAFYRGDLCDEAALGASIRGLPRRTRPHHSRVPLRRRSQPCGACILPENSGVDGRGAGAQGGCPLGAAPADGQRPAARVHAVLVGVGGRAKAGVRACWTTPRRTGFSTCSRSTSTHTVTPITGRCNGPGGGRWDSRATSGKVAPRACRSTPSSVSRRCIALRQPRELGPVVCVAAAGEPALAAGALERPAAAEEARPATTAASVRRQRRSFRRRSPRGPRHRRQGARDRGEQAR